MGSSSKQRKKTAKSAAPAAAAAAAPSTSNKPSGSDDDKLSLEEHLIRAQSAVEQSQVSTLVLHQQWRTQLLRMSYLVMVVTLHIAQTPSSACIKDIKVRPCTRKGSAVPCRAVARLVMPYYGSFFLSCCRLIVLMIDLFAHIMCRSL